MRPAQIGIKGDATDTKDCRVRILGGVWAGPKKGTKATYLVADIMAVTYVSDDIKAT
jgi:hypothetical protein